MRYARLLFHTHDASFIGCSVSGKVKGLQQSEKAVFEFSVAGKLNCMSVDGACSYTAGLCSLRAASDNFLACGGQESELKVFGTSDTLFDTY